MSRPKVEETRTRTVRVTELARMITWQSDKPHADHVHDGDYTSKLPVNHNEAKMLIQAYCDVIGLGVHFPAGPDDVA